MPSRRFGQRKSTQAPSPFRTTRLSVVILLLTEHRDVGRCSTLGGGAARAMRGGGLWDRAEGNSLRERQYLMIRGGWRSGQESAHQLFRHVTFTPGHGSLSNVAHEYPGLRANPSLSACSRSSAGVRCSLFTPWG